MITIMGKTNMQQDALGTVPGQHQCGKILSWNDIVLLHNIIVKLCIQLYIITNNIPISSTGCLTPISLLTVIIETSDVSGRSAASSSYK